MNTLIRTLGAVGLAAGIGAAAAWHWWRWSFSGGFVTFSPTLNTPVKLPLHHPDWWPTVVLFPVIGLVTGVLVAAGLTRLGWTMTRSGR